MADTRKRCRRRGAALVLLALVAALLPWSWRQWRVKHELAEARESLRMYQPEAAIERLTALMKRSPDCAEAEYLWAAACRRSLHLDEALSHLARAAQLGWNPEQVDRQRCLTFFQAGDFSTSGTEMIELLLQNASDDEADEIYEAMVRGYMTAMMLKQANFVLDGWIRWRPANAHAWLMRADVDNILAKQSSEIADYRAILRFAPTHGEARLRLAKSLMLSQLDEAFALYSALHQERPRDPRVLLGLAECHHRRGRDAEAEKLLAALLDLESPAQARADALGLRGRIELAAKNYAEAARTLREAVKADTGNVANAFALARALSSSGRGDEAKACLEQYQRLQRLEDELRKLREAILANPEDPDVRSRIGAALIAKGDRQSGVNWLLNVLYHYPSHPRTNHLLAEHYQQAGQTERAEMHRAIAHGKLKIGAAGPATLDRLPPAAAAALSEGL